MAILQGRERRKQRIRKKVHGTPERPRLTVFRSAREIYAQVIDDEAGQTLAEASSRVKDLELGEVEGGRRIVAADAVGAALANKCKEKGIVKVVFDRNGYPYHGRVKALADGARKAGLQF